MNADNSQSGIAGIALETGHAWSQVPNKHYVAASLLLSLVGGFTDAGSYVLVGSFTGHLTGNTVLAAVHLVDRDWQPALSCVIAAVAFIAGTAGGARWPDTPGRSAGRRLAGPVAVEIALIGIGLLVLMTFGPAGKRVVLASLCLALGLQNGALGRIKSVAFHTTFITGLSTTLIASLVAGKPGAKRLVLPPVIGCFVAGALCGAAAVSAAGAPGLAIVLLPLAAAWLLAVTDRSR